LTKKDKSFTYNKKKGTTKPNWFRKEPICNITGSARNKLATDDINTCNLAHPRTMATKTVMALCAVATTVAMQQPMAGIIGEIAPQTNSSERRRGDEHAFSAHCWAPGSAFADPSCNCLGESAHPNLGSRPTIKVCIGSWYVNGFTAASN
jgi:hypothetical protein